MPDIEPSNEERLNAAIVAAYHACMPPYQSGRTFEEQTAVWLTAHATRRALASVFYFMQTPPTGEAGSMWTDPECLRQYREKIIATAERDEASKPEPTFLATARAHAEYRLRRQPPEAAIKYVEHSAEIFGTEYPTGFKEEVLRILRSPEEWGATWKLYTDSPGAQPAR